MLQIYQKYLQNVNKVDLKHVIMMLFSYNLAFQKPNLKNNLAFPIAVLSSMFVSNTPEKCLVSTVHNVIGTTFFFLLTICTTVWCSSATKPELQICIWILIFTIQSYLQDRVSVLLKSETQHETTIRQMRLCMSAEGHYICLS